MNTENTQTKVFVTESDFEKGLIPKFFLLDWADKHGENPREDKRRYDKARKTAGERFCFGIVITFIGMFALALFSKGFVPTYLPTVVIVGGMIIAARSDFGKETETRWHEFTDSVEELFEAFHIVPDKEIGAMSREEFYKAITEALKASAAIADTKKGFERISYMSKWKEAHEIALGRKLCPASYDNFFPKKEK